MRKAMLVALLLGSLTGFLHPAPASAHVAVSIGVPGFQLSVGVPPVLYGPPVYYAPPVYYPYYSPYYRPWAPVSYYYSPYWHGGGWQHHGHDGWHR